jgi:hypothetical protein
MTNSTGLKITDNFPHKTIPPIVGQPTYEAIKDLHMKLNENAVKVHSNLGDGLVGYLGVTVTPAIYNTLSAHPFDTPPNPGTSPVFPAEATGPQIANIRVIFQEEFYAFKKYMDVCNTISAIIIEVIAPMYLATLRLPYVGLGTRTPLQLLAHLYTNYAKITPADLDANDRNMKQPCDVNQPIKVMYQQIEEAIEFAAAGQAPYSPEQVLNIAYQLVFRTGIFPTIVKFGSGKLRRTKLGHNSNWTSLWPIRSTAKRWTLPHVPRVSTPKHATTSMKQSRP